MRPEEEKVPKTDKQVSDAKKAAANAKDARALEWFDCDHDLYGQITYLHRAARNDEGGAAAIKWLLQCQANVNATTISGKTPLHLAALWARRHGSGAIVLLLKAKADLNACDETCRTPLRFGSPGRYVSDLVRQGIRHPDLLTLLVQCEGPDAVKALEDWKEEAKYIDLEDSTKEPESTERAHLRERLRVIFCRDEGDGNLRAWREVVNLERMNLFVTPEVQTTLHYLPGLKAIDVCHTGLLQALIDTANEDVFQTDIVEAVVQSAWVQMRFSTAWKIFTALLNVALLCYTSSTLRNGRSDASESCCLIGVGLIDVKLECHTDALLLNRLRRGY